MDGKVSRRIRVPQDVLQKPGDYTLRSLWAAGRALVSVFPHLLIEVPTWGKARWEHGRRMISTTLILSRDDWAWAERMSQEMGVPLSVFLRGIIVAGYKALYTPESISTAPSPSTEERLNPNGAFSPNLTSLAERVY